MRTHPGAEVQQLTDARTVPPLPWPALTVMAATVFVVVSGEMMPTAVLPAMAADLDVPLSVAGLLVSAWAATVVVASFPLTRLTARFERPHVIAAALAVVALATIVTATAGSYATAMTSRLVAAAATGLLWSTVNAHAASIVPANRVARATAVVLLGGMLGTVGAIPAGNAIARLAGWRVPFATLGGLALVAAIAVLVVLPRHVRVPPEDDDTRPGQRRALWPVLATAGLGGLVLAAHFVPFTFVAEILQPSAVPSPALLLLFGVVGAGGVALVGASSDRYPAAVPAVVGALMAVSLASLAGLGRTAGLDVLIVGVWGLVAGAVGPAIQARLMHLAGPEHRATAGTLMPVAMNLGIAVGAAAGSGALDVWSPAALPVVALVPALLAVVGLLVLTTPARGAGSSRG